MTKVRKRKQKAKYRAGELIFVGPKGSETPWFGIIKYLYHRDHVPNEAIYLVQKYPGGLHRYIGEKCIRPLSDVQRACLAIAEVAL
jgi:hypothetical protein